MHQLQQQIFFDSSYPWLSLYRRIQTALDNNTPILLQGESAQTLYWFASVIAQNWPDCLMKNLTYQGDNPGMSGLFFWFNGYQEPWADMPGLDHMILPSSGPLSDHDTACHHNHGFSLVDENGSWRSYGCLRRQLAMASLQSAKQSIPLAAKRLCVAPSTLYRWLST